MKESADRQKELVQAIVNQRDMYRTLLAQSTPLPGDSPQQPHPHSQSRGRGSRVEEVDAADTGSEAESESKRELAEVKEQFEAYRKEKEKNDTMLQQQLEKLREESSEIKIHNAKLGSKVHGFMRQHLDCVSGREGNGNSTQSRQ